ncbi:MAG TPA: 4-hydroxyphenylpyruvate dioxygenase [Kineosporiaceae bacterium]
MDNGTFADVRIDHIEFAVADVEAAVEPFTEGYGFSVYAVAGDSRSPVRTVALGRDEIRLVFTSAPAGGHPAAAYVEQHGDGVSVIALSTREAGAAFAHAVRRGAVAVAAPTTQDGVTTATIRGFGDVMHTFVQRAPGADPRALPGLVPQRPEPARFDSRLHAIDHLAVCLDPGTLEPTVEFYREVLGFEMTFEERIVVGRQAMNSKVVRSRSGDVTLTLIEPDTSREQGQIDSFLKNNGGPGVQHLAFATDDVINAVRRMAEHGVEFLDTPDAYYGKLPARIPHAGHPIPDLRQLNVLVDQDHDGQLFQIFTRSVHPRGTIFMEVIERMGARSFGSGNITALYEAVALDLSRHGA